MSETQVAEIIDKLLAVRCEDTCSPESCGCGYHFRKEMTADLNAALTASISREATLVARIRAIELTVDGLNTKGFQQKAETQSALDRIKAHCRDAINSKPAA